MKKFRILLISAILISGLIGICKAEENIVWFEGERKDSLGGKCLVFRSNEGKEIVITEEDVSRIAYGFMYANLIEKEKQIKEKFGESGKLSLPIPPIKEERLSMLVALGKKEAIKTIIARLGDPDDFLRDSCGEGSLQGVDKDRPGCCIWDPDKPFTFPPRGIEKLHNDKDDIIISYSKIGAPLYFDYWVCITIIIISLLSNLL